MGDILSEPKVVNGEVPKKKRAKKKERRYQFLPTSLQGGEFMVWLKRLHGWIGMWGAIVGLIIGITGITLNHRAFFSAGEANEVTRFQLEVPDSGFARQLDFETYVKENMGFSSSPVVGMGGGMAAANAMQTRFNSTTERYDISWVPGNQFATVTHTQSGVLSTMDSLHLGNRGGLIWVLILDAFAGSLIFTSITGLLLWSKMDGSAMLAVTLLFSFLAGAFYFAAVI